MINIESKGVQLVKIVQESEKYNSKLNARYRCKQIVVTKIGGIVVNSSTIKQEFLVTKYPDEEENIPQINVFLKESIVKLSPETNNEAMQLLNELELIKGQSLLSIYPETGKMKTILNHQEMIERWNLHKNELQSQFYFLRAEENKKYFDAFINTAELQLTQPHLLLQDYSTKLFYRLFFDNYLVTEALLETATIETFFSHFFDNTPVNLYIKPKISFETPDKVLLVKKSDLDLSSINHDKLVHDYNERFKPMTDFTFSEYNYGYQENKRIHLAEKWIEHAEVQLIEEVKNNIQLFIKFTLDKVAL